MGSVSSAPSHLSSAPHPSATNAVSLAGRKAGPDTRSHAHTHTPSLQAPRPWRVVRVHPLSAPLRDRHLACHPPASGEERQENSHRSLELEGGRGARGGREEGPRAVQHPWPLHVRARGGAYTRTDTRARTRAHTPKKSSVTCSLSKPALTPVKLTCFPSPPPPLGVPVRGGILTISQTIFKKESVHWVLYTHTHTQYVFVPPSSSLVRPFCTHTSLALLLSSYHKPPTSAGSPGLEPLPFTREGSLHRDLSPQRPSALRRAASTVSTSCHVQPGAAGSRVLAEPPNFLSPSLRPQITRTRGVSNACDPRAQRDPRKPPAAVSR